VSTTMAPGAVNTTFHLVLIGQPPIRSAAVEGWQ
jgi:hypothetical protein